MYPDAHGAFIVEKRFKSYDKVRRFLIRQGPIAFSPEPTYSPNREPRRCTDMPN